MSKLMKPLFINGMYNREGKRIRANYLKTITDGKNTYPLWIEDGKPNKDYVSNDKDKYYLYIEVNDWLIMTGYTEYQLGEKAGYEYLNKQWYGDFEGRQKYFDDNFYKGRTFEEYNNLIKEHIKKENDFIKENANNEIIQTELLTSDINRSIERYIEARDNNGKFADFVGAVFLNELDKCEEIASVLRKAREEAQRVKNIALKEQKEKERIEREQEEEKHLKETESIFINGGTIKDGEVIVKLADKYNVNIPIRTRGWILDNLSETTITESGNISYRYWRRSKNAKGSQTVYDVLFAIRSALKGDIDHV